MKILLTGASGYIGGNLLQSLKGRLRSCGHIQKYKE
jgi:Nucleoside-diphosphate-sugar epimerases